MIDTKKQNRHRLLSLWIIVCGLLYIFAYQFKFPFKADTFLYCMVVGLLLMTLFVGKVVISLQVVLFFLVAVSSFIGLSYTKMPAEGLRETILFAFFTVMFCLSLTNSDFVKLFAKWIYIVSIIVVLSSIIHFIAPAWFNLLMRPIMREDAYRQLMWSYSVDNAFAGLSAYTPNMTFAAAVVFGNSLLNIVNKKERPIVKSKLLNIVLLLASGFSIIICSKRSMFVATVVALIVLMFYLYLGRNFFLRFVCVAVISSVALMILYSTNEFVASFFNRFVGEDVTTGRNIIYETLLSDFAKGNFLIGRGTGATYELADSGAHNIYLQILYDHGIVLSIPYYTLLLCNYFFAFKNKCPLSIFVQTIFLVYGLVGNPLYSNMLMMIYIYHVLLPTRMPKHANGINGYRKARIILKEQRV